MPGTGALPRVKQAYTSGARRWAAESMAHLERTRLTPNALTASGVGLCVVAAGAVYFEHRGWWLFWVGAVLFFVGSILDILDGALARRRGTGTQFGAFIDSTVDRVGEGFMLGAIGLVAMRDGIEWGVALAFAAIAGSYLVSYTRARAEALGVECKVGVATRAVRVVILSAGLLFATGASLFDARLLEPAIYLLAALTTITVLQRVLHVRGALAADAAS
jgi:phosphatidylglycerophosphate synthase